MINPAKIFYQFLILQPNKPKMETILNVFIVLHLISGSIALMSGGLNIFRQKGNRNHKKMGKTFFVSMIFVGISSLVISYLCPNYFLFIVGILILYMVLSGQFYLKYKTRRSLSVNFMGWSMPLLMLFAGLVFVDSGILMLLKSDSNGFTYMFLGLLGLVFVKQDFKNFRNKSKIKNYWLIAHLQRMTGSFVTTLTALLIVTLKYFSNSVPNILFWLIPAVIFTPLIIYWSGKYEVRKND